MTIAVMFEGIEYPIIGYGEDLKEAIKDTLTSEIFLSNEVTKINMRINIENSRFIEYTHKEE